ncbi:type II toxin-antitoxin system Phd/YefM family antitoxin [Brevibacterium album]|uniref:type II toxin-antitoxin system Phd/YefM family antitoxin n=1 Tax=Brevibacterium album TaxID=417948 RepID=UPI000405DBA4|nr:type II toxin-antitoxin system prevent-host-death family antitoxin [Brevibacterium album]
MTRTVPIGRLRQNPTEVLSAVEAGESFVVTNHRRPVADLVPHREAAGISGAELMRRLRRTHRDSGWLGELNAARESESARDPWA